MTENSEKFDTIGSFCLLGGRKYMVIAVDLTNRFFPVLIVRIKDNGRLKHQLASLDGKSVGRTSEPLYTEEGYSRLHEMWSKGKIRYGTPKPKGPSISSDPYGKPKGSSISSGPYGSGRSP